MKNLEKNGIYVGEEMTYEEKRRATYAYFTLMAVFVALLYVFATAPDFSNKIVEPEQMKTMHVKTAYAIETKNAEKPEFYKEVDLCEKYDCNNTYEEKTARVTAYSEIDSCHYPTKGGGCLTASGYVAKNGVSVACPYNIELGTQIEIAGKEYKCHDRTAHWVQNELGETYDIFVGYGKEAHQKAKQFGSQNLKVKIYE